MARHLGGTPDELIAQHMVKSVGHVVGKTTETKYAWVDVSRPNPHLR